MVPAHYVERSRLQVVQQRPVGDFAGLHLPCQTLAVAKLSAAMTMLVTRRQSLLTQPPQRVCRRRMARRQHRHSATMAWMVVVTPLERLHALALSAA